LFVRYTQALITQMSQTAICARHHTPEQQLCRWLLLTLDRVCSTDLLVTHELIGTILGMRRETVTETLHKLKSRRLIALRRKHLHVCDRAGLEAVACGCYVVIRDEYAILLPPGRRSATSC
jgi:CRP-like cAMP-binding protein